MKFISPSRSALLALALVVLPGASRAAWVMSFEASDFGKTQTFNNATVFSFEIQFPGGMAPGVYNNPTLLGVNYNVFGVLSSPTPSTFPAFNLVRTIGGSEFYSQGSSLSFEIDASANLLDGLQFSDLVGGIEPIFTFDGREVGTGRYHPSLVELRADGTGRMQNSNNFGGINPGSGLMVDVDYGEEYITDLTFTPSAFTIGTGDVAIFSIPEPTTVLFLGLGCGGLMWWRRHLQEQADPTYT